MFKTLAVGALIAVAAASPGVSAETPAYAEDLSVFLGVVRAGELRSPQRYSTRLQTITSRDGRRTVAPTLDVVAGRLDERNCVYQLRMALEWSGRALAHDDAAEGGRSLIQQAPCATLTQEVVAVAIYEVSTLERRLREGGRFAVNRDRDQIIAAARRTPVADFAADTMLAAVTIDSRVNLRGSPSLRAPVLAKLAPASLVQLAPTNHREWFAVRGRAGYVHISALQSIQESDAYAPDPLATEAEAFVTAEIGTVHVSVRESPTISGRVVGRLKPGTKLRLATTDAQGWFELADGVGFIHESGLTRVMKASMRGTGARAKLTQ